MSFLLIKGTFHVQGYSPDGDSLRFRPDDPDLLRGLEGFPPKLNPRGHVQLRIEAIDAPETHYAPSGGVSGGVLHQPPGPAQKAADFLLEFVGIRDAVWDARRTAVLTARDGVRGHILARSVEKNGRPVAFVYADDAPEPDGSRVFMGVDRLVRSYNYAAITRGRAYPTFYQGLFHDLRDCLARAARQARADNMGLYADDATTAGFDASSLTAITSEVNILPKLFRRLSEYLVAYGSGAGFKAKMAEAREPVFDLVTANFTHFDTFIEEEGDRIRMTRRPEELVFDEMPTLAPDYFTAVLGATAAPTPTRAPAVIVPEGAVVTTAAGMVAAP